MVSLFRGGDQIIIERIRANDRYVLGDLFIKFEKLIVHHIQSNGGTRDDGADILQESIIVLWQQVVSGKFELTSRLSTYLLAIAKNKWLAELRRRRRLVNENIADDLSDDKPSALEQLVDDEYVRRLHKAMEHIQPLCRQILLLFYFEERSMEEIAQLLNFANTNVAKSKKYQCKKALQEILIQLNPVEKKG